MGIDVLSRFRDCPSLVDLNARYHCHCWVEFMKIPVKVDITTSKQLEINSVFKSDYIRCSNKGKFTLTELRTLMGDKSFTTEILYRKLYETFGNNTHINQIRGSETTIYYKDFSALKLCGD